MTLVCIVAFNGLHRPLSFSVSRYHSVRIVLSLQAEMPRQSLRLPKHVIVGGALLAEVVSREALVERRIPSNNVLRAAVYTEWVPKHLKARRECRRDCKACKGCTRGH
jgi:hypothetical protein